MGGVVAGWVIAMLGDAEGEWMDGGRWEDLINSMYLIECPISYLSYPSTPPTPDTIMSSPPTPATTINMPPSTSWPFLSNLNYRLPSLALYFLSSSQPEPLNTASQ